MSPSERDKWIKDSITYWRNEFRISPDLAITVKFVTNRDDDEDRKYATISLGLLPYNKATLEIYDDVFSSKDFKKTADQAICHEMLHIALSPLVCYCNNMFIGDEGKQRHLEDAEEAVVTLLEGTCTRLAGRTKSK